MNINSFAKNAMNKIEKIKQGRRIADMRGVKMGKILQREIAKR